MLRIAVRLGEPLSRSAGEAAGAPRLFSANDRAYKVYLTGRGYSVN